MPSNQDIAELITMVAATEEQIEKTAEQLAFAQSHWINRIHPLRRRRLNAVRNDIVDQRANMVVAKDYIKLILQLRKIES